MNMQGILADASAVIGLLNFGEGNTLTDTFVIILSITLITLLIAVIVINKAVQTIYRFTMPELWAKEKQEKLEGKESRKAKRSAFWSGLMGLHKLEEEAELTIENHEYDGISELNNPIPVWFNVLFYSTVVFGFIYLLSYHVFGWGMNQDQEYEHEMAMAEKARQEYLAQAANLIDENTIEIDPTGSLASSGKSIFIANCAACHGNNGEGTIGPNLTDRYWIHGGEIKDIFRTVKYGVPDKGMVPWDQTLTPGQIAEVSNYIITLRDTKPANPKQAEGVEVVYEYEKVEADLMLPDSTAVH